MSTDHRTIGRVDSPTWFALYRRIKRGVTEPVVAFVSSGGDPDLRAREYGSTLLHAAASAGTLQLVEALIAAGADIEALNTPGFTPLACAAHGGHVKCMRVLLAAGASTACRPLGVSLMESLAYAQVESRAVREVLLSLLPAPSERGREPEQEAAEQRDAADEVRDGQRQRGPRS